MIEFSHKLYYKDSIKEIANDFSIQLPDDKSPEELRQYLAICHDAATKSVKSCDIEAIPIEGENKAGRFTARLPESSFKKDSTPKPASAAQLATAHRICATQGISPEAAAGQYGGGASRLEDLTGKQLWKFINENLENQSNGEF